MGLLETIEGKMDTLIAALNENTKARLAGGEGAVAAPATDKPRAGRKPKEDTAPAGPKTDEATLVAKFDELKARGGDVIPRLKKIIADVGGVATLPELRQVPAKFDVVMDALVALQTELDAPAEEEEDL